MKLNLEKFLPSRELAREGIWREIYPGISLKIAFAGSANKAYKAATIKLAFRNDINDPDIEKLTDEQLEKIGNENVPIYAECIIKDWKGIIDEDTNQAVPYSKENAFNLLNNYPEVFDKVIFIARNEKLFSVNAEKETKEIKKK